MVITSCGHAGVINAARQRQKATGLDKGPASGGGFPLAPAPDALVATTVPAFKALAPADLLPAHGTGAHPRMAGHRERPATLVLPATGTRVLFGASGHGWGPAPAAPGPGAHTWPRRTL